MILNPITKGQRSPLYSKQQVAAILTVSSSTVGRMIKRGLLKPVKGIWRCRIPHVEVDRFLTESVYGVNRKGDRK